MWKACSFPSFLEGRRRDEEPCKSRYDHNGGLSELYYEHLLDYELTYLRQIFLEEMKRQEHRWLDVYNSSQLERDFDLAVESCDSEFLAKDIRRWIEDVASGCDCFRSLRQRIYN